MCVRVYMHLCVYKCGNVGVRGQGQVLFLRHCPPFLFFFFFVFVFVTWFVFVTG